MSREKQIKKLLKEGITQKEIADRLGCSTTLVRFYRDNRREITNQNKKNFRARVNQKIRDIKESSGCIDCGGSFPHYVLEFDHLPGFEKVGSPSALARDVSLQAALDEIAKCDVVCANCHNARTWFRAQEKKTNEML